MLKIVLTKWWKLFKYLGILETHKFLVGETKVKISKVYFRLSKKVLKSKLSGASLVKEVSTFAVWLFRYLAAFISLMKIDLQDIDRKSSKLVTIYYGRYSRISFLASKLMEVISPKPEPSVQDRFICRD